MNTAIRYLLCTLAVGLSASGALPAEPASNTGRVLVLDSGRVLEGDIRREGDSYCVQRTAGQVWLPTEKVVALCASWQEAYAFMRSQANLHDPDDRLRLARWCQAYGLHSQALAEATAALQMRPTDSASKQLVEMLQRLPSPAAKTPPAHSAPATPTPVKVAPAIELSTEALGMFATRVQPVLMNTCAACHAASKTTAFKLVRAGGNNLASRRATQQNMSVVLAQIDPAHPNASPLLMRAVTDHGKVGQTPLKAQSAPYCILQEWIQLTLATNPFLREQATSTPPLAMTQEVDLSQPPERPATSTAIRSVPIVSQSMPVVNASKAALPAVHEPTTAGPVDEFDPAPYNRQFHPARQDGLAERGASAP